MTISQNDSLRIQALRFPLVVGIVYIHNYECSVRFASGVSEQLQSDFLLDFLRNLISWGLARLSVPLFFLIAGYLFYNNLDGSFRTYVNKLKSREKSLLVPFLFWNAATLALAYIGQALPMTKGFFSNAAPVNGLSLYNNLAALFGLSHMPAAYHFWFVRDLMIMVILTPLLYRLLRTMPLLFFAALCPFVFQLVPWPLAYPSVVGLFYYTVGGYLALHHQSLFVFDKTRNLAALIYFPLLLWSVLSFDSPWIASIRTLASLFGCIVILSVSKWLIAQPRLRTFLCKISAASFFVYAAHEPLLTIARKLSFKFFLNGQVIMPFLFYIFLPIAVIVFLLFLRRELGRFAPHLLYIISGGNRRHGEPVKTVS